MVIVPGQLLKKRKQVSRDLCEGAADVDLREGTADVNLCERTADVDLRECAADVDLRTGLQIPQAAASALNLNPIGSLPVQQAAPPIATQCFMLANMFDPISSSESDQFVNNGTEQELSSSESERSEQGGVATDIDKTSDSYDL
uniref:Splicing factor RBM39 linker domain-containing protein n=1 Tax=Timema douglasi TaxID=61478 RepID=A0A7R8VSM5_TIMDO|nr:unnamed protein product [Timema douglasi]